MGKISETEWDEARQDMKGLLELMQEAFEELVDDEFLNTHEQYELTESGLCIVKILENWDSSGKTLKEEYFDVH